MQVLLVAAKKDMVMSFSDLIREAGLQPLIVDVDSFATQNALAANYDFGPDEVVAILNIGAEITNINIVQGGVPYFTKDLQVGGNTFIEAAQRKFNLSQTEAAARCAASAARASTSCRWSSRLRRPRDRARARAGLPAHGRRSRPLTRIMLCGGASHDAGRAGVPEPPLHRPAEIANPLTRIEYDPALFAGQDVMKVAPLLTVGIGLALRRLGDKK